MNVENPARLRIHQAFTIQFGPIGFVRKRTSEPLHLRAVGMCRVCDAARWRGWVARRERIYISFLADRCGGLQSLGDGDFFDGLGFPLGSWTCVQVRAE